MPQHAAQMNEQGAMMEPGVRSAARTDSNGAGRVGAGAGGAGLVRKGWI